MFLKALGAILIGYLLGAFPTGVIVAKICCGADVRQAGSGHTGGSNVARVVGSPWPGVVTAIIDLFLGGLAAYLGPNLCGSPWGACCSGVAAVIGHNWSLYIGLAGGIGLSSLFGMLLAQATLPTLTVGGGFALLWLALRKVLGHEARCTMIALPLVPLLLLALGQPWHVVASAGLGALVVMAKSTADWRRTYKPDEGILRQFGLVGKSSPSPD